MAEIILAIIIIAAGLLLGFVTLVGAFGTAMGRATNPSAPSHDLIFPRDGGCHRWDDRRRLLHALHLKGSSR